MHGMVQKATSPAKRLGRPPTFDRTAVVDAAVRAFWDKGVSHTTLRDLEDATGADRSTLYNSFDGKAGLHRAAADAYVEQVEQVLFAPLLHGTEGLADVEEFLDRLRFQMASARNPAGCFVVNDLAAPDRDAAATDRYLRGLRSGVRSALGRAAERGEIASSAVAGLAETVVGAVLGANLVHRHAGTDTARAMLDGIRAVVSERPGS